MVDSQPLKAVMPNDAGQPRLVFHALQFRQRPIPMQRFHRAAGDRKPLGISPSIAGYCVVRAHGVLDTVRLNIAGCREYWRLRNAVGTHYSYAIRIIAVLPTVRLLEASAVE